MRERIEVDRFTFRGRRADTKEWIYGAYISDKNRILAIEMCDNKDGGKSPLRTGRSIEPDTIGQCSPFRSIKDQPIFDGDILLNHDTGERLTVFWCDVCGKWMYEGHGIPDELYSLVKGGVTYACEVVGNVHEGERE